MQQTTSNKQLNPCEINPALRLFFALTFSEEERAAIEDLRSNLKKQYSGLPLKWISPENLHLTLYFCGEVTKPQLEEIIPILSNATFPKIFKFTARIATIFPNTNHPVALVLEPEICPQLLAIHKILRTSIDNILDNPDPRPYRPHITLAKIPRREKFDLQKLKTQEETISINIIAKKVTLLCSNYVQHQNHYHKIASWLLLD
ncbi:MAG: RNA 2',3'-cyclic phosphodiesterase [Gammaproteobacteria bacterium]|nr:RNA 2',3'-cyclic phosphodiesterase [Gammaproteobacteria bacterium]